MKLRIADGEKPVLIQTLIAQPTIQAYEVTVLNRLTRLNEEQLDAVGGRWADWKGFPRWATKCGGRAKARLFHRATL
jgi:hypothetical protein